MSTTQPVIIMIQYSGIILDSYLDSYLWKSLYCQNDEGVVYDAKWSKLHLKKNRASNMVDG
jgi:hypothetical protein